MTHSRVIAAASILAGATLLAGAGAVTQQDAGGAAYIESVEQWRAERETALRADDGWLAIVGLTWLHEGRNTVGSGESNDVRLPAGSAPERVGVFDFAAGVTTFVPAPGAEVAVDGRPASRRVLRADSARSDRVKAGTVTMFIIKRADRYGVRIRDTNSPARGQFPGCAWFPVEPRYRITARFVPHARPATILIANVLGNLSPEPSPGYAEFTLEGREYRLHPITEGPNPRQLFFIIKDRTAGAETYGGGRFLYAEMPKDGVVVLDFNKAENPPCAFTAFATCPLPPKENVLPVRIEAGEKAPH